MRKTRERQPKPYESLMAILILTGMPGCQSVAQSDPEATARSPAAERADQSSTNNASDDAFDPGPHEVAAAAALSLHDLPYAIGELKRVVELRPGDAAALEHLGAAYYAHEMYPQAAQAFRACIALDTQQVATTCQGALDTTDRVMESLQAEKHGVIQPL
jgi:Flp pilus assembly protein TadD